MLNDVSPWLLMLMLLGIAAILGLTIYDLLTGPGA